MNQSQFNQAEITWAKNILARPPYTMHNGKQSHAVAHEVLNALIDRLPALARVNAYGQFKI